MCAFLCLFSATGRGAHLNIVCVLFSNAHSAREIEERASLSVSLLMRLSCVPPHNSLQHLKTTLRRTKKTRRPNGGQTLRAAPPMLMNDFCEWLSHHLTHAARLIIMRKIELLYMCALYPGCVVFEFILSYFYLHSDLFECRRVWVPQILYDKFNLSQKSKKWHRYKTRMNHKMRHYVVKKCGKFWEVQR